MYLGKRELKPQHRSHSITAFLVGEYVWIHFFPTLFYFNSKYKIFMLHPKLETHIPQRNWKPTSLKRLAPKFHQIPYAYWRPSSALLGESPGGFSRGNVGRSPKRRGLKFQEALKP